MERPSLALADGPLSLGWSLFFFLKKLMRDVLGGEEGIGAEKEEEEAGGLAGWRGRAGLGEVNKPRELLLRLWWL